MSSLIVKNLQSDDELHIFLHFVSGESEMTINMNRLKTESCKITIQRLRLNIEKKLSKKSIKKRKKKPVTSTSNLGSGSSSSNLSYTENVPPTSLKLSDKDLESTTNCERTEICTSINILHGDLPIDLCTSNEDAWIDGAVLRVDNENIPVLFNPPSVTLSKLPAIIMEGFSLYPNPKFEFAEEKNCEFLWKQIPPDDVNSVCKSIDDNRLDINNTVSCPSYTPSAEDVGHHILLACIPRRGHQEGEVRAVISKSVVTLGPGPCPFEKRHSATAKQTDSCGGFRVLTYNLLAEMYTETEKAKIKKFFYCPRHLLDMEYRKHLLLKEILGYQADVLCLQEVDKSIFHSHLSPALSLHGYCGLFRPKLQAGEGCATFYRDSKFTEVKQLDITLTEYLTSDPCCADIWQSVCQSQVLKQKLLERSSILQTTVIKSVDNPNKLLCVANTHLYWHPYGANVRLIQSAIAIRYIESVCAAYRQEGYDIAVVFCGDFNSSPRSGVCSLYLSQSVKADHHNWSSAGPESCVRMSLSQPMNLVSACGMPKYTHFTPQYTELLDWIFIDADLLSVEQVVPMPDHEDVVAHRGLPCDVFPSDHLALICDLKFKS